MIKDKFHKRKVIKTPAPPKSYRYIKAIHVWGIHVYSVDILQYAFLSFWEDEASLYSSDISESNVFFYP
jgi:hypothetical protein